VSRILQVKTTVDLPGPSFGGVRMGDSVYVSLDDVIAHLTETAHAFDNAHADADIGRSFRAYRDSLERARVKALT
jgi:hypothetical protein